MERRGRIIVVLLFKVLDQHGLVQLLLLGFGLVRILLLLELVGDLVCCDVFVVDIALGTLEPVYAAVLGPVVPRGAEDKRCAGDDARIVHICCTGNRNVTWHADDDADKHQPDRCYPGDNLAPEVAEVPYARFELVRCHQACYDGDRVCDARADDRERKHGSNSYLIDQAQQAEDRRTRCRPPSAVNGRQGVTVDPVDPTRERKRTVTTKRENLSTGSQVHTSPHHKVDDDHKHPDDNEARLAATVENDGGHRLTVIRVDDGCQISTHVKAALEASSEMWTHESYEAMVQAGVMKARKNAPAEDQPDSLYQPVKAYEAVLRYSLGVVVPSTMQMAIASPPQRTVATV